MSRPGADAPLALEQRRTSGAALAGALLAGERGAAVRAWKVLSPMVMRLVGQAFIAAPDRQDLCQEIFLRFFARVGELREPQALRSFLFGICLGVTRNEQRRQRVRRIMSAASEPPPQRASAALPDDDAREALGRFCRVLAAVAPEDRSLFVSRHVDKLELADIATARGWSLPVTKRRVARMNRRLALAMLGEPALAGYAGGFLSRCGRQTRGGPARQNPLLVSRKPRS